MNEFEALNRAEFEQLWVEALAVATDRLGRRYRDPQLVEEVVCDALTVAFERWQEDPTYFHERNMTSWCTRLASWRIVDRLRDRNRHRPLPEEDEREEGVHLEDLPEVYLRRENDSAELAEIRHLVWVCLQMLPEEDRWILEEHYYAGRCDRDLGDERYGDRGDSQANNLKIWRRRQKALARLEELLGAHGPDELLAQAV